METSSFNRFCGGRQRARRELGVDAGRVLGLRKEDYSPEERAEIAERVRGMLSEGRDVYVFFKHEDTPAGARYAEDLLTAVR